MRRIYLDHAATTPCSAEAWDAMRSVALEEFGNPNSLHREGRVARERLEAARSDIASDLGCFRDEVAFTATGTESNNLALRGLVLGSASMGRHLITTTIEHAATINTCRQLEKEGYDVTYLPVDSQGFVVPDQMSAAIRPDTALVSFAHANNEVGTVQHVQELTHAIRKKNPRTRIHIDGVQTVGHVPSQVFELDVDLLSFTAHKFYGPKGIAGLFIRRGVKLTSQLQGGGQERGLRSGTQAVQLAVGMAVALRSSIASIPVETKKWTSLRDDFMSQILETIGDSRLTGHPHQRLPGTASFAFLGISGEDLTLRLDRLGYATSTGAACSTGSVDPSPALLAMGLSRSWATGSLRVSFGRACEGASIPDIVQAIASIVSELRSTHQYGSHAA